MGSLVLMASLALWSEFLAYDHLNKYLPELRANRVALNVALSESLPNRSDFYAWLKGARAQNVEIRVWLLLDEKNGYWFNKWNAPHAAQYAGQVAQELEDRGLTGVSLVFDLEPPPDLLAKLEAAAAAHRYGQVIRILKGTNQDRSLSEARAVFRDEILRLKAHGFPVYAVTSPWVLHDLKDDQQKYQGALGLPIQGLPWDEVSFMVYRAEYRRIAGDVQADLVYRYARIAAAAFGSSAALDLGEVGSVKFPKPFTGYADPKDLREDFEAALAGGVRRLHVYSLDGLSDQDLGPWLKLPEARAPQATFKTGLLLAEFELLRLFLDRAQ